MNHIIAKVKIRGTENKYRKILSSDIPVYSVNSDFSNTAVDYDPGTLLDDDAWFKIASLKEKDFCIGIIKQNTSSVDFDMLTKELFSQIDFIFTDDGTFIYFQNISKTKLISKKFILHLGEDFKYDNNCLSIPINELPDAIYEKNTDSLYFRKLSSITSIFKGLDQLYREATEGEVQGFLEIDFICLKVGFNSGSVNTSNRRRIAIAVDTLKRLKDDEKRQVFDYIKEYCPNLRTEGEAFSVNSEDSLKQLLYGIEQRYYTTLVGGEKRLANSVIKLS